MRRLSTRPPRVRRFRENGDTEYSTVLLGCIGTLLGNGKTVTIPPDFNLTGGNSISKWMIKQVKFDATNKIDKS